MSLFGVGMLVCCLLWLLGATFCLIAIIFRNKDGWESLWVISIPLVLFTLPVIIISILAFIACFK